MHIVLTGASSGIGEAMARFWGDRGHKLTLAARREDLLTDLAGELSCDTLVYRADLSDLAVCPQLVEAAVERFGPIDVLVNNAGIQYVEPAVGVSPERAERLFTVDLLAPLQLQGHVLPSMIERRSGTIVNISSVAGIIATPGMMHYNAAKAGLAAASESLRVELRGTGVHVLTVYPGPVESPMEAAAKNAYTDSAAARSVPTGKADELARLIDTAIERRTARIVYPRIYGLTRYTRVISQWITDRATPPLRLGDT